MDVTVDLSLAPADLSSVYRRQVCMLTIVGAYAAGGFSINPNDVRMGKIYAVLFSNPTTPVAGVGYQAILDPDTGNILFIDMNTGAEAADATNVDGVELLVEVIGQ